MKIQPVQSRAIALVGYDKSGALLEVVFRSGGVYHYADVPEEVHRQFLEASSHSQFFKNHIENRFSSKKIC